MSEQQMLRRAQPGSALPARLAALGAAWAVYAALWGSLSSLGALSGRGVLPLGAGFVLCGVLCLLPARRLLWPVLAVLAVGAVAALAGWGRFSEGCGLYLNRLFAASEAAQPYLYEKFEVGSGDLDAIRYALLPFGLWTGAWLALCARRRWRMGIAALPGAMLGLCAWLGVVPAGLWLGLIAGAMILALCLLQDRPSLGGTAAALAATALAIWLTAALLPGVHPGLSAWEQSARDRLAPQTISYAQREEYRQVLSQRAQTREFLRQEEEAPAPDAPAGTWLRPAGIALAVLLILALLFGPALWRDRLHRRAQAQRAGLQDPDPRVRSMACVLYALRWLRLAGLARENLPFSAYAPALETADPALGQAFRKALPLWQEAAYSGHVLSPERAREAEDFLARAETYALGHMTRKQKLYARYVAAMEGGDGK